MERFDWLNEFYRLRAKAQKAEMRYAETNSHKDMLAMNKAFSDLAAWKLIEVTQ